MHRDPMGRGSGRSPHRGRSHYRRGLGRDHWQAAQAAALASSRGRHLSVVTPEEEPHPVPLRLDIEGDVDVAVPDLARYETKGLGS